MIERPCREETSRPLEIVLRGRKKKEKRKEVYFTFCCEHNHRS